MPLPDQKRQRVEEQGNIPDIDQNRRNEQIVNDPQNEGGLNMHLDGNETSSFDESDDDDDCAYECSSIFDYDHDKSCSSVVSDDRNILYDVRDGVSYASPTSYQLKDEILPNSELVGDYKIIWVRYSIGSEGEQPCFNYHRTCSGSAVISVQSGKIRIKVSYCARVKHAWLNTPVESHVIDSFDLIENPNGSGGGMVLDSIKNLSMKSDMIC